jgi:hypothetical protein
MWDAWLPAEKVAEQSLQPFSIGLGRGGFALLGRIVVQAHDGLAAWTFTRSIERPFPPVRIDEVGQPLELFPLLLVVLAL